jgi:hypothetical protein
MTDDSLDLFEVTFWNDLKEFADDVGITPRYAEEEFCLEGDLIKVYPNKIDEE